MHIRLYMGTVPKYLEELVTEGLDITHTCRVKYSKRCFERASATLWNNLPANTRMCKTLDAFKNKMKTNLSTSAFLPE